MDRVIINHCISVETERDIKGRHAELTVVAKQQKESIKKLGHTHETWIGQGNGVRGTFGGCTDC